MLHISAILYLDPKYIIQFFTVRNWTAIFIFTNFHKRLFKFTFTADKLRMKNYKLHEAKCLLFACICLLCLTIEREWAANANWPWGNTTCIFWNSKPCGRKKPICAWSKIQSNGMQVAMGKTPPADNIIPALSHWSPHKSKLHTNK